MSQPDVLSELRAARPSAPPRLHERVHAIATATPLPPRRLTRRRAALVLVPALLALAAGAVVLGRSGPGEQAGRHGSVMTELSRGTAPVAPKATGRLDSAVAPPPSRTRLQDYDATLRLHLDSAAALSDAVKRAVRIATSLGGFASTVQVETGSRHGDATLRLRVPATKVQIALQRLSELGTITGESVGIQDVQAGVNALDRRIARLQRQLRDLRAQAASAAVQRQIATLTAQVQRLQRSRADSVRRARLATIQLALTTRAPAVAPRPADHGPLHGAVVALTWLGVGALYGLVVGGPVLLLVAAAWLARRSYLRAAERRLLERR